MVEEKMIRLSQATRELNIGISTIKEYLADAGIELGEANANTKITLSQFAIIAKKMGVEVEVKPAKSPERTAPKESPAAESPASATPTPEKTASTTDAKTPEATPKADPQPSAEQQAVEKPAPKESSEEKIETKLQGLKVLGKIDLPETNRNDGRNKKKKQKPAPEVAQPKKDKPATTHTEKIEKAAPPTTNTPKAETTPAAELAKTATSNTPTTTKDADKPTESQTPKATQKPEAPKETPKAQTTPAEKPKEDSVKEVISEKPAEQEVIKAKAETLSGLTVLGKIELPVDRSSRRKPKNKPIASSDDSVKKKKKRKKRVGEGSDAPATPNNNAPNTGAAGNNNDANRPRTDNRNNNNNQQQRNNDNRNRPQRNQRNTPPPAGQPQGEISAKQVQDRLKATLNKMSNTSGSTGKKKRRNKSRDAELSPEMMEDNNVLRVTEFISVSDIASLMDVSVNEVISACLNLGMFVSINQRLDAEAIEFIADEFDYKVEFTTVEEEDKLKEDEEPDAEEDLEHRAPIVTIMGHVDHGKTSLLDYIRKTNVTSQEAGGITQHVGAYSVNTGNNKKITFLDTPGHEAFTAMRARGARVTDIVILVVAADDSVMPQTEEAINHALVAGVPIVVAINKIDKPTANPEKIRKELAEKNILVESWGGKYQDQEISAKTGLGVEDLLEKVLIEAEILELKANPNRNAVGTVIEASLDKGRGYVTNVLVQTGTMRVGDVILAGSSFGRVKAMTDHLGRRVKAAGPSFPVQVLGLNGAPQAGDVFKVMDNEREAREIASKREQILRQQAIRATKGLTLDEIGRRRALGNFKELKIIVKGDVDGSIEALSDSLLQLSTEEIEVKIIHKAVGQISESDILLASASEAIILGFQVRPSANARKLAEQEKVEIKLYSIIYDAINEVRDAMEGMLAPKVEEEIVGNVEIRETFKISKVGTVAGCYVTDGYIKRTNRIRIIRDGIVIYEGELATLKRFKDDVNEVRAGYECGLNIRGFNDIKVGDVVESYEQRETKRTL
ncbi:translation initiation factor IF-2 [Eisenibacter elegans]|uniref:translation initiation factor IF-2 n=1 Tax=Eisenibacter elegans TaxID=997 RepID=UPI00041A19BE|nr:translation initiation factor IF-2 [Eisenibacter elegans]